MRSVAAGICAILAVMIVLSMCGVLGVATKGARMSARVDGLEDQLAIGLSPIQESEFGRHLIGQPYGDLDEFPRRVLGDLVARKAAGLSVGHDPLIYCWAPGTDPELMLAFDLAFYPPSEFEAIQRWDTTATDGDTGFRGTPITLTWSIVPDGVAIPGTTELPGGTNNINARMTADFGSTLWITRIQTALDAWTTISGIEYVQVTDDGAALHASPGVLGMRGDVRISSYSFPTGNPLAYNMFPDSGDMVMNGFFTIDWSQGATDTFFRNVISHEAGHGQGLAHVIPENSQKLMEPTVFTSSTGPREDDIRGSNRFYGDPFEDNDTAGTANALGNIAVLSLVGNMSTDGQFDADWYSFTAGPNTVANVQIQPVGSNYLAGPEDGSPIVVSGTSINNLDAELIDSDGTTVLLRANHLGTGATEVLNNFVLPTAGGTFFVRVFNASGGTDTVQRYQLIFSDDLCAGPQILQQPQNTLSCAGQTVTMSVMATGGSLSYQWFKNGTAIPGATSANLMIGPLTAGDAASYTVDVTNSCTTRHSFPATLSLVSPPVSFTIQPAPADVMVGDDHTFFAFVAGAAPLSFQWQKDGEDIPEAMGQFVTITDIQCSDAGEYQLIATNPCGPVGSNVVTLTVEGCDMETPGDCDGDGDVDLVDFGSLQLCFTGPGGGPVDPECACSDFDGDDDVDLVDFGEFQLAFTGPL